jgi:hypothetical protein
MRYPVRILPATSLLTGFGDVPQYLRQMLLSHLTSSLSQLVKINLKSFISSLYIILHLSGITYTRPTHAALWPSEWMGLAEVSRSLCIYRDCIRPLDFKHVLSLNPNINISPSVSKWLLHLTHCLQKLTSQSLNQLLSLSFVVSNHFHYIRRSFTYFPLHLILLAW